jgi:hypothetical protein
MGMALDDHLSLHDIQSVLHSHAFRESKEKQNIFEALIRKSYPFVLGNTDWVLCTNTNFSSGHAQLGPNAKPTGPTNHCKRFLASSQTLML